MPNNKRRSALSEDYFKKFFAEDEEENLPETDTQALNEYIATVHDSYDITIDDGLSYVESSQSVELNREVLQSLVNPSLDIMYLFNTFLPNKNVLKDTYKPEDLYDLANTVGTHTGISETDFKAATKVILNNAKKKFGKNVSKKIDDSLLRVKKRNNTLAILSKNSVEINTTLEVLHENLLFLKDAVNLVIGESKSGKTYTTCKSLVDNGFKDHLIHIDFDRNSDDRLRRLGVKTYHISDAVQLLDDLKANDIKNELLGKILVIDSLQDLSEPDGLDTNKSALDTMNNVLAFKNTGATVIVIHHTTLDSHNKFKVKGNATTITSKCDTTLKFVRNKNIRTFEVLNTRAEDKIASGTTMSYNGEKSQGTAAPKEEEKNNEPPARKKRTRR